MTISQWTDEWPTEPGTYLFYGTSYVSDNLKPRLKVCLVKRDNDNELFMIAGGSRLRKKEQYGMFTKLEEVDLPTPLHWAKVLFYRSVYGILQAHGGLKEKGGSDRDAFVRHFVRAPYRVLPQPSGLQYELRSEVLGLHSTFSIRGGPHVKCEFKTPERQAIVETVNGLLQDLMTESRLTTEDFRAEKP